MDKDENKPVEKPKEEKPNTKIQPPKFESQKHTYKGETMNFIDKIKK